MNSSIKVSVISALTLAMIACSTGTGNEALTKKKEELAKLKKEQAEINESISKIEKEIDKLDTTTKAEQGKLVVIDTIEKQPFTHFIDLQGKVDAENISYVTPRGAPGLVRAVYVKEGDFVPKGKLLLKLDDAIIRQNVVAAKQAQQATRTQLELAKSIYNRQKNLWEQNIGTEVQLLQAKTNVEALEANLKTQMENVKIAEEQLATTSVYSHVSGIAEEVNIHVGETFTGSPMAGIKIVNTSNLKIVTNVPENYLTGVKKGTPVVVSIPDLGRSFNASVSLVSQTIGVNTRGFLAEIKVPSADGKNLKPNMIAVVRIQDYVSKEAITVPVNTLQSDQSGKYVMVAVKEAGNLVARKRNVIPGEFYNDKMEIVSGLKEGEVIVSEGYQNLYDGQIITTTAGK